MTPTQRTLALLRSEGWHPAVVEKWIPRARVRQDLFGFGDVLALHPDGMTLVVQTTSGSNAASRVRKITDSPMLPVVRKAGWKVCVHAWRKGANGRWACRVIDLS